MLEDRSYERALEALETLISGRKRSDGKTWEEQYLAMHAYLEVRLEEETMRIGVGNILEILKRERQVAADQHSKAATIAG